MEKNRKYFHSLTGLKAVMCLIIVFHHTLPETPLLRHILSCRPLKCLAKISMSVFFWHMVVHQVLFWALPYFVNGGINQDLWFVIYLVLAMVVSTLSYKYLENGLFRKKTGKKRGAGEYPLSLEELGDCCGTAPDPEQLVEGEALAAAIAAFLRTQPQQVQHVFVGRYYFMDPVKEIARYCQMSESNVKVLLFRTRKALQTHLVKEGFICD
jgi:hypothetical protein